MSRSTQPAVPEQPSKLCQQLKNAIERVEADAAACAHPLVRAWVTQNPDVPLSRIYEYSVGFDPGRLLWKTAYVVKQASELGGWKIQPGGLAFELIVHISLVACERIVRAETLKPASSDGVPHVRMFNSVAAAIVAATWLGIGLRLHCTDGAGRSIEVINLVLDRAETQLGVKTGIQAIEDELAAKLSRHLAPLGASIPSPAHPRHIRAGIDEFEEMIGARLVVAAQSTGAASPADATLRKHLADNYSVEMFLYAATDEQIPEPQRAQWVQLQEMLRSHFETILRPLQIGSSHPTSLIQEGGSMARAKVFISYAHKDEKYREYLVEHLGGLEREGLIERWDDRRIGAGADWDAEIDRELRACKVAVLLVSPAFLGSKFITSTEVPTLLARHGKDGMHIVPVLARACAWKKISWLAPMQIRPPDGNELADKQRARDKQLALIATEIAELCEKP